MWVSELEKEDDNADFANKSLFVFIEDNTVVVVVIK